MGAFASVSNTPNKLLSNNTPLREVTFNSKSACKNDYNSGGNNSVMTDCITKDHKVIVGGKNRSYASLYSSKRSVTNGQTTNRNSRDGILFL